MKPGTFALCAGLAAFVDASVVHAEAASAPALPALKPASIPALPATTAPAASKTSKVRVAVPNMVATNSNDAELAKTLTQVLTIEVNKVRGIEAIGMADIEALLNHEQQKALLGCEDASCIAEIGGALGVDALLSSSIGRVGDTIVLSIRLNDTHNARQIGSAYESVSGKPDELIRVVQRKVPEVVAQAQPAWALEATTAASTTTLGKRGAAAEHGQPGGSGFHIVWPAFGVTAAGGLALVAAGVFFGLGLASGGDTADLTRVDFNDHEYWAPGAQEPFDRMKAFNWAGVASAGFGALLTISGVMWQIVAGFDGGTEVGA